MSGNPVGVGKAGVRKAALKLLARREHTCGELADKLSSRSCSSADISVVLQSLADEGLLSDLRATQTYIRQRVDRGYGNMKIHAELQRKGVDDALIMQCLRDANIDWLAVARRVIDKKFSGDAAGDSELLLRQQRFLSGRGFPDDVIRRILRLP